MARKYFGTDGIRGLANGSKLTPELALRVGMAAGHKQTVALLGYPIQMEEAEIEALARRLAERFWRAYAV